jgi:hypothetical protein
MSKEFKDLVKRACAAEMEFRRHSNDGRMSPQAMIEACYAYGGTSPAKVTALREALDAGTPQLRESRAFVHQVSKLIREGRYGGVPRDTTRMSAAPSMSEGSGAATFGGRGFPYSEPVKPQAPPSTCRGYPPLAS